MQSFDMVHAPTGALLTVFLTSQEIHGQLEDGYEIIAYQDLGGRIMPVTVKLSELILADN